MIESSLNIASQHSLLARGEIGETEDSTLTDDCHGHGGQGYRLNRFVISFNNMCWILIGRTFEQGPPITTCISSLTRGEVGEVVEDVRTQLTQLRRATVSS